MSRCFYCDIKMSGKGHQAFHAMSPTARTTDHIVPVCKILAVDRPTQRWHELNCVQCCNRCNNLKGDLWPLEWLELMPVAAGVARLSARLLVLGCPPEDIAAARARRK